MFIMMGTDTHACKVVIRQHNDDDIVAHCNALREEYGKVARHSSHIIKSMKLLGDDGWLTADVDGKSVGFIGCVIHEKYAMLGFYVVAHSHRGKGIGKMLWDKAIALCGERNLVLYADKPHNYRNKGMTEMASRYFECIGPSLEKTHPLPPAPEGYKIEKYTGDEEQLRLISNYDDNITPIPRHKFLEYYLNPEAATTHIVMDQDQQLVGYATIKWIDTGLDSYAIGPFYADSDHVAELLLVSMLKVPPIGSQVICDAVRDKLFSMHLMNKYNLDVEEDYVLLFMRNAGFDLPKQVYGITSPCIGPL